MLFYVSLCVIYAGALTYVSTYKSQMSMLSIFLYCWDPAIAWVHILRQGMSISAKN